MIWNDILKLKLKPHDDGLRYNDISEKEYACVNLYNMLLHVALPNIILFRVLPYPKQKRYGILILLKKK